jgi:hypothetical protein
VNGSHKITLEIEPGTSIEAAAADAQWMSDRLALTVTFDFNGIECFAVPGGDAEQLALLQRELQTRKPRVFSDGNLDA